MTEYHKMNPFPAKIKERELLSKSGSTKKTYHISLDLESSNLRYKPGDAIGVFPHNSPSLVEELLSALEKSGEEQVTDPRSQVTLSLRTFLLTKVNLNRTPSPLFKRVASESFAEYDLIDFFHIYSARGIPLQELISFFSPLLPRFYSVASAQSQVGNEVHLLVATFIYQHGRKLRRGVGSDFLCETAVVGETAVPIYVQSSPTFTLPKDPSTPILMIGPGTGVAPYRAFLQERHHQGANGNNWLIFGERNQSCDYYYEEFLKNLTKSRFLTLDTAFSRDQKEKLYVQHRLLENGSTVWQWLQSNAYIYICGDARHMAKDVTKALHTIIEKEGNYSPTEAKDYLKQLRRDKRLLMDVY